MGVECQYDKRMTFQNNHDCVTSIVVSEFGGTTVNWPSCNRSFIRCYDWVKMSWDFTPEPLFLTSRYSKRLWSFRTRCLLSLKLIHNQFSTGQFEIARSIQRSTIIYYSPDFSTVLAFLTITDRTHVGNNYQTISSAVISDRLWQLVGAAQTDV